MFDCAWFVHMRGTDPNSGKEVDEHSCSMAWMPMLLVENALHTRHTGAAVESFRNEMVKANQTSQDLLLSAAKMSSNMIELRDITDE
jgi:hypothetical protein